MIKRKLTFTDLTVLFINLIPLWGVWFKEWDPLQIFLVYCAESIIAGLFNVIKMLIVTQIKKKDLWENNGSSTLVSGYFFILFFIIHYGFFVFIQLILFISSSNILSNISPFKALFIIPTIMNDYTKLLLLSFVAVYALKMLFDFIITEEYKTISLGRLMFSPYMRIFVQQFAVIIGGFILSFGGGKLFMLTFVIAKIFFEIFMNYERLLFLAEKRQRIKDEINKSGK